MEILFATHNNAKLELYKKALEKLNDVSIVSLNDINVINDIEETGNTSSENAYIKASEYNKITGKITASVDDSLILEGIPDKLQPGVNVRRVNGIKLSDEDMIKYYTDLVSKYGKNGQLIGYWNKSIAIAFDKERIYTCNFKVKKIFTNKVVSKRNIGYPMDSITITPEYECYTVELDENQKKELSDKNYKIVCDFINEKLKEYKGSKNE